MKRKRKKLNSILIIIAFLAVWEIVTRLGLVNTLLLPPLSDVLLAAGRLAASEKLSVHIFLSMGRALGGLSIAILVAIPAGVLLGGMSRRFQIAVGPVVEFFSQLNPFILYHLILIFMGIGEITKVTIITWACIWPLLFSTISGVCHIDPIYMRLASAFRLNRWQMAVKVIIPAAMPQIMYGVRMSASYSLFMLIAAEMMGGESGLGFLIVYSQKFYQVKNVYALVIIIALLGVMVDVVLNFIESRLDYSHQEDYNA